MFWYSFSYHALPWLAGSYPLGLMDDLESGIFGFLMKNWIDSAKKFRRFPKFAVKAQRSIGCVTQLLSFPFFLPGPAGAEMKYGSKIYWIQADPLKLWDSALNTIA